MKKYLMKDYLFRAFLLAVGWLIALLLTAYVQAGIIVSVSDNVPPPVKIPAYTQQFTDAEYAAWANTQNEMNARVNLNAVKWIDEYIEGTRTITTVSGSINANGHRNRHNGPSQSYGNYSGSASSITMPYRERNPDYRRPPLTVINPYCRPKVSQ